MPVSWGSRQPVPGLRARGAAEPPEVAGRDLQGDGETHGLLPAHRALDREAGDQSDRAAARPLARQRDDARRRHPAHPLGPLRRRRLPGLEGNDGGGLPCGACGFVASSGRAPGLVTPSRSAAGLVASTGGVPVPGAAARPEHPPPQQVEPGRVRGDEGLVHRPVRDPHVQDREHERAVRAGAHRQPLGAELPRRRGPARVDHDHGHPAPLRLAHPRPPLAAHDAVDEVGAPEHDHPGVAQRRRVDTGLARAEHHPFHVRRRRRAVRRRLLDAAADQVEEAWQQLGRVVQRATTGAGAAEGEDGAVAVSLAHRRQPFGDPRERLAPARLTELPRPARPGAHERRGQAPGRLLLAPRLVAADAALEVGAAGRVVGDAHDPAALDRGEQRAAAAAVAVAGDRQASSRRRSLTPSRRCRHRVHRRRGC